MISCKRRHLDERCRQRGYTPGEVAACIVSDDGDTITVDETHSAYPREPKPGLVPPQPQAGPGSELKKLLSRVGITATPNCKCNARAKHMDAMEAQEPGWCERNIDTVVGYLREAAADRGLPFLDAVGKLLVRRAISNARQEQARATKNTDGTSAGSGPAVRRSAPR